MISRRAMIFISFAILAKIATLTGGSNNFPFHVPNVYPPANDQAGVRNDGFQVYGRPSNMQESKEIHAVVILSKDGKQGMDGVYGVLSFSQSNPDAPVKINGTIYNLPPGQHGMHVHTFGDLRNGCTSCGVHYNPRMLPHGDIHNSIRHNGDLGNVDSNGNARVHIHDKILSLSGDNSILGRSMVVHEKRDDGGRGGNEESTKTGNSGARVACGIIALSEF